MEGGAEGGAVGGAMGGAWKWRVERVEGRGGRGGEWKRVSNENIDARWLIALFK